GKPIGSMIAEDLNMLSIFLTRTAKDPNGPKEISIKASKDTPYDRFAKVLNACLSAGFKKLHLTNALADLHVVNPVDNDTAANLLNWLNLEPKPLGDEFVV